MADESVSVFSAGDRRVNTEAVSTQPEPSVASLSDGGWVVAYESLNEDEYIQPFYMANQFASQLDGDPTYTDIDLYMDVGLW